MKVSRNFGLLSKLRKNLESKLCWQQCDNCKEKWSNDLTKQVHMVVKLINRSERTFFVCDNCVDEVERHAE